MLGKRSALVVVALGLLVATGSCRERSNPISPPEPQMAKGGKPTGPAASTEPDLQEFWVYTTDDEQCIHIVMSGTYASLGFNPAYDYFFNGWQDVDDHYEVYQTGFPGGDIQYREVDGVALGHTDICYHGERQYTTDGPVYFKDFPTTEQGLQALLSAPGESEEGSVAGWDGPYVNKDEIPRDPWGNEYQYVYPPERGSGDLPDIWSFGPDGEDNTEDDICTWTKSSEAGSDVQAGPAENLDIDVDVDLGSGN